MIFASLMSIFKKEVTKLTEIQMGTQVCRVTDDLPRPLQRHFKYCGYTGNECARLATVTWKNAKLKFSPEGKWCKIKCEQINALTEPARLVYIHRKLFGFFPFGAIDEYVRGNGQMLIKLWNIFTLQRARGKEMDQAELVTILAETMLIPAYAIQYYITWEEIDQQCVKGTIQYQGISASGTFHFAESGEMVSFKTGDRFYTGKDGHYEQVNWVAKIDYYEEKNGRRVPAAFSATWKLAGGDHEYFKGDIANITYTPFETYCIGDHSKPVIRLCRSHQKLAFP